ncbi:MAG TPA: D-alanyl-D-alanine carboxypeptidase family protein [Bacillota bacterium]|nr:D-alanyl-D-alanine carboxypeptidase family protein [Bacillota bacterium]
MRQRKGAMTLAVLLALVVWLAALTAPAAGPGAAAIYPAASAPSVPVAAAPRTPTPPAPAPAAIPDLAPHAAAGLLMDAASGRVIWSKNPNQARPVASITKLMTEALVLDAIDSGRVKWTDDVSASEGAVKTVGSQIWLELGENMSVKDLFIALAVASANDAAYALAEHVGGTYDNFIQMMNAKAQALGMKDTVYTNPHGLDEAGQQTSAHDVALLSRYLVTQDPQVLTYSSMWEYRLRGNQLWLVNRNKLLKMFAGADGLKTGYTAAAGYGLAATALRGTTRMIAVVLGEPTADLRFAEAGQVLQYGFAHFVTPVAWQPGEEVASVPVEVGTAPTVKVRPAAPFGVTVARGQEKEVESQVQLPAAVRAPVTAGQQVGEITVTVGGAPAGRVALVAAGSVPRAGPFALFGRLFVRGWPWLK